MSEKSARRVRNHLSRYYRRPLLTPERNEQALKDLRKIIPDLKGLETEEVFYIQCDKKLTSVDREKLLWLLRRKSEPENTSSQSFLGRGDNIINVAPRLHFETSDSTNAVSICQGSGLDKVTRMEKGRRYKLKLSRKLSKREKDLVAPLLHDKMTEAIYPAPLSTFQTDKKVDPIEYIDILGEGREAIRKANERYGTKMDEVDEEYYLYLFRDLARRNPTDAEWLHLSNAFSEHSRHHIFRAKLIINKDEKPFTLMELIQKTLTNKQNSVIAFYDNGSAIRGYPISLLIPDKPGFPSEERMAELLYHYVLTCETHNHPCLWAAYPGAATGGGGRRRDNKGVGRGGLVGGAVAGFMGGNLLIEGYDLPWEDKSFNYDPVVESPLSFFIRATKGAFDEGNQFGEPVTLTFAESLGILVGDERWEFIKPIMFSGGYSFIDSRHIKKKEPQPGWLVVKLGGKAYRIGLGGGAASSMVQGENREDLDMNSVQRADGEMSRKVYNCFQTFIQMGEKNPIEAAHDQGAGGVMNVGTEILELVGGEYYLHKIPLGDKTMSAAEILVSEYQENMLILVRPENASVVEEVCEREKCPWAVIGTVTGDGKVVVLDEKKKTKVVDLNLKHIMEEYPQKTLKDERRELPLSPLKLPEGLTVKQALSRTSRLLGVASKEWMADEVDSSVSGRVVQSQKCGPLGLPVNPYSLISPDYFGSTGEVNTYAYRPALGLVSPEAMARMVAAEAYCKLMFTPLSNPKEVKSSANWMLAAKLPGGIAWLYDAALSLSDFLNEIDMDIDGGKDSLSLAASVPQPDGSRLTVRSPGTLVLTTYAACPNSELKITPDIKKAGESRLVFIDLAYGRTRLGGSALAQVFKQTGGSEECPDVVMPNSLPRAMACMQSLLQKKSIKAAQFKGRGGLIQALNKMAFAGNCGYEVAPFHKKATAVEALLNEELGLVLECDPECAGKIEEEFGASGLGKIVQVIGSTSREKVAHISFNGRPVFSEDMLELKRQWRETSFQMKAQVVTSSCVEAERKNTADRIGSAYRLSFDPDRYGPVSFDYPGKPKAAILYDEGSNSLDEAILACYLAGFAPFRVSLMDLAEKKISLEGFNFLFYPGGFTYKDVLGSAKGYAGMMKFNPVISAELDRFYSRPDTLSLGVCNGCQVMTLLNRVPYTLPEIKQPDLLVNESENFESRFSTVKILDSPCVFTQGMEGSVLGVYVAHGEGRFYFPGQEVLAEVLSQGLAPIRFVDDYGSETEKYPFNPNGSSLGITALCDPSGRHLAFMEHPERTILKKQWEFWPSKWDRIQNSPWLRLLQNARWYCEK